MVPILLSFLALQYKQWVHLRILTYQFETFIHHMHILDII